MPRRKSHRAGLTVTSAVMSWQEASIWVGAARKGPWYIPESEISRSRVLITPRGLPNNSVELQSKRTWTSGAKVKKGIQLLTLSFTSCSETKRINVLFKWVLELYRPELEIHFLPLGLSRLGGNDSYSLSLFSYVKNRDNIKENNESGPHGTQKTPNHYHLVPSTCRVTKY